jgi:hypothetical protein
MPRVRAGEVHLGWREWGEGDVIVVFIHGMPAISVHASVVCRRAGGKNCGRNLKSSAILDASSVGDNARIL